MDMILKGCKIHTSVRKTLIYRFQSLLSEGCVYQISFFSVGESGHDLHPTSHPFKINLHMDTFVRLVPNKAINLSPYNFVPLSDIMFKDIDTCDWNSHRCNWVRVECTFFGKYVAEVVGYLASGDATNVVVVRQVSKMFMGLQGFFLILSRKKLPLSELARCRTRQKKSTPEDDFLKHSDEKTIEQLKDLAEYIAEGMDWCYPACKCSKKEATALLGKSCADLLETIGSDP
ncbi:uncharacterized protein LOC130722475 [Lotus japonicus]|uniref:uncharacterized protein LOC130722475 n=1 Tax=Lotus japonicus TaxID=34305 RepID=UPI00258F15EE|nr:uncharacterized protein LOC130722475 [Lotus japonicus]